MLCDPPFRSQFERFAMIKSRALSRVKQSGQELVDKKERKEGKTTGSLIADDVLI